MAKMFINHITAPLLGITQKITFWLHPSSSQPNVNHSQSKWTVMIKIGRLFSLWFQTSSITTVHFPSFLRTIYFLDLSFEKHLFSRPFQIKTVRIQSELFSWPFISRTVRFQLGLIFKRPSIFMTVHFEHDLLKYETINLVESSLKPWWHKLEANLKLFLWVRLVDLWTAFSSLFIHTFVPLEVVSLDPRDYQPLLYYVITLCLLVLITSLKDIGSPKLCQKFRTHAPLKA